METKLVRVPFDIELAKKITNGEVEGRIITASGEDARIICFDSEMEHGYPIIVLVKDGDNERLNTYKINGDYNNAPSNEIAKLMLEIPEYMTFKEGNVLQYDNGTIVFKCMDGLSFEYYCSTYCGQLAIDSSCCGKWIEKTIRFATESEKQKLIDALKESKKPKAKEYLKRFFGIEEKKEYEFNPKDWVLCKSGDEWCLCLFSHKTMRFDGVLMYVAVGGIAYEKCIPYNEQTAHLLGSTDDWEDE